MVCNIAAVAAEFPLLSVGSYPFYGQLAEQGAKTVVIMEGTSEDAVKEGIDALLRRIPNSIVLFQADGGCLKLQHDEASAQQP
jgi:hypothetical protein